VCHDGVPPLLFTHHTILQQRSPDKVWLYTLHITLVDRHHYRHSTRLSTIVTVMMMMMMTMMTMMLMMMIMMMIMLVMMMMMMMMMMIMMIIMVMMMVMWIVMTSMRHTGNAKERYLRELDGLYRLRLHL
jgi:hypothetical protein